MPLTFTFALSQNQTFELRCSYGTRRLDTEALARLINLCEEKYYTQDFDRPAELKKIGQELYQWLDGKEGWLRQGLEEDSEGRIYLDLIQTSEAQALNLQTQKVALGLAHLPWELLHNGSGFLLREANVLPVRSLHPRQGNIDVQNRPLRLLFMATSPEYPGIAPLGFEQEEANILEATKEQPLALVVEESGSVEELGNLVRSYKEDYFDVFHLTGHGVIYTEKAFGKLLPKGQKIKDNTPCFITEDDFGNVVFTTAEDLGKAFKNRFPRVIFLSGCHTGQLADGGTVPSMAQALVKAGAGVVLGWARPVYDTTGITAAEALYEALATGATVEEAIIAAHQKMLEKEHPDGHLLRVYRDTRQIQGLVTPLRSKGREKLKFKAPETEFLDENNIVKVASRGEFVGRRKALQRCLRALRETSDEVGVFIAGMGGLGKSSLAARLCTRVQSQRENFERVVLIGVVDEVGLINKLANKYQRYAGVPALLNEPGIYLQGRLQNFFEVVETQHGKPLLLVLDDFEQNIPPANIEDGSLRMTGEAYRVLEAICAALAENQAESRLIVTCRYLREDTLPPHNLHLERLAAMGKADIDKIVRDLEGEVKEKLRQQRIIKIADGNPRLLKWLLDVVQQPGIAGDELLTRLEAVELKFRENILAQTLLRGLEDEEKKFLARLSVFRLPVTEDIVRDVAFSHEIVETQNIECLHRLVSLSLVESATVYATQLPEYRVTTILEPLLQPVLTAGEWQEIHLIGVRKLYKTWQDRSKRLTEDEVYLAESEGFEMIRLGLLVNEQKVVLDVGNRLAATLLSQSRFVETFDLCQQIIAHFHDSKTLMNIATAENILGFVDDALVHYQQALDLCTENNSRRKAIILNNMARILDEKGNNQKALQLYKKSLKISKQMNFLQEKSATLTNMAWIIAENGDSHKAIKLYSQSLEIKESIGDIKGKAGTLNDMASLFAQQGDIEKAFDLWQQSLQIARSIVDIQGESAILANMAQYESEYGDIDKALAWWHESLKIDENIQHRYGKTSTLSNMIIALSKREKIEESLILLQQYLQISASNIVKVNTIKSVAKVLNKKGNFQKALYLFTECLNIETEIGDILSQTITLSNMALIAGKMGDNKQQFELNLKAAKLCGQIKNYDNLFRILWNLGVSSEEYALLFFAQAMWLAINISTPLTLTIKIVTYLCKLFATDSQMQAFLGITPVHLCKEQDEYPQLEELRQRSFDILSSVAEVQGIVTQEEFDSWIVQQRLDDPEYFIPRLIERLEEIVGDEWLFERF